MELVYENSAGEKLTIGPKPFTLVTFEGLGGVEADTQKQRSPFQDGSTYLDSFLIDRSVSIVIVAHGETEADLSKKRMTLSRVFSPKAGIGTLNLKIGNEEKQLGVVSEQVPFFPDGQGNQGPNFQRVLVELTAPDPYWKSPSVEESPAFEPLFEFPFEGEFEMGISRDARIINNDGSAPAPLQVDFYGPAVNPRIENKTTGEFIQVNQTLEENEYMRIDTTPGQKSVVFVSDDGSERNVFNWIDLESTFFKLVVGENEIEYTADSNIQGAVVDITWNKLYAGV